MIVEPWLLLWTGGCGACGADIDRLSALVVWHCGTAIQRTGVDRQALCVHWAAATPASQYTFHQNYIRPSMPTQNGRDGLAGRGAPNLPCPVSRSQSRMSMKNACPWKLYTPPCMCGDVMYVCHSIRRTDHDNVQLAAIDIKALADVDTASRCILPRPC